MIELDIAEDMRGAYFVEPRDTTSRSVGLSFSTGYSLADSITMAKEGKEHVQSILDGLGLNWQKDKPIAQGVRSRMCFLLKKARRVRWQGQIHSITEKQRNFLCKYLAQEDASTCGITALLICIPLPSGRL